MNNGSIGRAKNDMIAKKAHKGWILAKLGSVSLINRPREQVLVYVNYSWVVPDGETRVSNARQHIVRIVPHKVVYVGAKLVYFAIIAYYSHVRYV